MLGWEESKLSDGRIRRSRSGGAEVSTRLAGRKLTRWWKGEVEKKEKEKEIGNFSKSRKYRKKFFDVSWEKLSEASRKTFTEAEPRCWQGLPEGS